MVVSALELLLLLLLFFCVLFFWVFRVSLLCAGGDTVLIKNNPVCGVLFFETMLICLF